MLESRGSLNGKRGLSTFTLGFMESEKARRPYEGMWGFSWYGFWLLSNLKQQNHLKIWSKLQLILMWTSPNTGLTMFVDQVSQLFAVIWIYSMCLCVFEPRRVFSLHVTPPLYVCICSCVCVANSLLSWCWHQMKGLAWSHILAWGGGSGGLIGALVSTLWSRGHYKLPPDTQKPTEHRCCEEDNAGNTLEVNHIWKCIDSHP